MRDLLRAMEAAAEEEAEAEAEAEAPPPGEHKKAQGH